MKSGTEKRLKVVHLNKMGYGGAFIAAFRLYQSQIKHSCLSKFIVAENIDTEHPIESFPARNLSFIEKLLNKLRIKEIHALKQHRVNQELANEYEMFRFYWSQIDIIKHRSIQTADIIHLHWVVGLIDFEFIQSVKKPIVWTLHDMNPFTGGCHYSQGCEGFLTDCNLCPGLNNKYPTNELSNKVRALKKNPNLNLTIVSPSKWLFNAAKKSTLLKGYKHVHIPYGLDEEKFNMFDQIEARKEFSLPLNKKIVLFCSGYETYRKGFDLLSDYYISTATNTAEIQLVCVGPRADEMHRGDIIYLGYLNDSTSLAKVYSAADLLVVSSREDNLPNTVLEALFCGCPVVGFNVGGLPDMIKPGFNGLLADQINSECLGRTIEAALTENTFRRDAIRVDAITNFSFEKQFGAYEEVYHSISCNTVE